MTRRAFLLPVVGEPRLVDASGLTEMYAAIGCDTIDVVGIGGGWAMVVDDNGLLTGRGPNPRACILYGTPLHGHPIVGDVLLASEAMDDDGEVDLVDTDLVEALLLLEERGAA